MQQKAGWGINKHASTNETSTASLVALTKQLGKHTFIYIPGSVIPALFYFGTIVLFARLFPPEQYGLYSVAVSLIGAIDILVSCWLQQSIMRYRATYVEEGKGREFSRNILIILLLLSIAILIAGGIFFVFFGQRLQSYRSFYWPGIGCIVTGLWFVNFARILAADLKPKEYIIYISLFAMLSFLISFIWVFTISRNISAVLWGKFFAALFLIVPIMLKSGIADKKLIGISEIFDVSKLNTYEFLRKMLAYGFPLIGWFLGSYMLHTSDRFFINAFKGSSEVGVYSANYFLVTGVFSLLATPFIIAAHSIIMKVSATNGDEDAGMEIKISAFSRYFLLAAIPFVVYTAIFSKEIAAAFLGSKYQDGYIVIPIILFGYLAWNYAAFGQKGLELAERTKRLFLYIIICALVNVALNFIFVPWLGYIGAAITSLIALSLYPVLVFFGTRKILPWLIPWRNIVRITAASLLMALLLMPIKLIDDSNLNILKVIISSIIGITLYSLTIYYSGELLGFEKEFLRNGITLAWKRLRNKIT